MTLAPVIQLRPERKEKVAVHRLTLRRASENAVASSRSIEDAVKAAEYCVISGNQLEAVRLLRRIGHENAARLPELLRLTALSEQSGAACPDCGDAA